MLKVEQMPNKRNQSKVITSSSWFVFGGGMIAMNSNGFSPFTRLTVSVEKLDRVCLRPFFHTKNKELCYLLKDLLTLDDRSYTNNL